MVRHLRSHHIRPMRLVVHGSGEGGGLPWYEMANFPLHDLGKISPPLSVSPHLYLLAQLLVPRHPPYKREVFYLWLPFFPLLPSVCLGPPVLFGHPAVHLNLSTAPMIYPPFLILPLSLPLRYIYLCVRLGSACKIKKVINRISK